MKTEINIIVVILLILSATVGFMAGYPIGKASVPSVYENVQGIRVLQHLLKEATDAEGNSYYPDPWRVDGQLGEFTVSGYRNYDRDNIGFVEDKLK